MNNPIPLEAVPYYGLQAIHRLSPLLGTPYETAYLAYCIDGIQDFVESWDDFRYNTTIARLYQDDLIERLHQCRPIGGLDDKEISDCAFVMFECLANIFREAHLKQPTRQLPPAQASLMQFFEECGEWTKGDGNLVTDHYYFVIPSQIEAAA